MNRKLVGVFVGAVAALSTMPVADAADDCAGGARQIPDALAPACRGTTWSEPNGGSSWNGVEADSIRIVLYNDMGISGDMNSPWSLEDEGSEPIDEGTEVPVPTHLADFQRRYLVRTIKAHLRYFKERFQTFGRDIDVLAQSSTAGITTPCAQREGDAETTKIEYNPFAVVVLGDNVDCYVDRLASEHGIMSFGALFDVPRQVYTSNHPSIWSLFPDQETEAALSASFICRKLFDRPARFAGDPELRAKQRRFGLLYPLSSQRGDASRRLGELLVLEVQRQCDMDFADVRRFSDGNAVSEALVAMRAFQVFGISTVVCYCVAVGTELTVVQMQEAASLLDYHPEWYWDHASRMDKAVWHQTFTTRVEHPSFGSSYLWRMPALRDQPHYRAYLEEEPETTPNERFSWQVYHSLLHLFTAIQEAGISPTPTAVAGGLTAHAFRDPSYPWAPSGGHDAASPSPHTFIDTDMAWWWDPLGTAPGDLVPQGCIRTARDGARSSAGGWPEGDGDLFFSGDPCTGPSHNAYP